MVVMMIVIKKGGGGGRIGGDEFRDKGLWR